MFNSAPQTDLKAPPLKPGVEVALDWDAAISLDMIRQHTKTDDVPSVTDDQLRLYRRAAVEAAEHYTGLMLAKQMTVSEPIRSPHYHNHLLRNVGKTHYKFTLQYPVSDGVVWVYGGRSPDDNRQFMVPKNSRTISIPIRTGWLDLTNCCNPCASPAAFNEELMALYKAGYACAADVPAGVMLGILQFIAWVIEHPGDEFLTTRNRVDSKSGGAFGSNNIAMVSGALETWRQYDPEAI